MSVEVQSLKPIFVDRQSALAAPASGTYLFVCDQNTRAFAPDSGRAVVVPPGEAAKSFNVYETVLVEAFRQQLTRGSTLIAIGGGAVCDLAAFVASTYMRGVSVILVPTTLLAMVDAAIGGKTGVNADGFKNGVGTFYVANEVRIAVDFLATLSEREYRSGLAEVIKAAFLGDAALSRVLRESQPAVMQRDRPVVAELIDRAVAVKTAVVAQDLREAGVREHLNLGHTFGHALEACAGIGTLAHGEAVAWGIGVALRMGVDLGITSRTWCDEALEMLVDYGYDVGPVPYRAQDIVRSMQADKKRRGSRIRVVLQRGPQDTLVTEVATENIVDILNSLS